MPQASLMTWLNKPQAVSEPQVPFPPKAGSGEAGPVQLSSSPLLQDDESEQQERTKINEEAPLLFQFPEKPLPANVELRACTKEDIAQLKNLTGLLLPIPYPETFYREIIADPLTNSITLLAVWHDDATLTARQKGRLIGAIRCRLLARPPGSQNLKQVDDEPMLYLSTLVLLSPYRGHGIASHLLQTLTKRAIDEYGIASVGAHVWESNADALEWYRKRGFCEVGRESGYYRRLDPQGAVIMQRKNYTGAVCTHVLGWTPVTLDPQAAAPGAVGGRGGDGGVHDGEDGDYARGGAEKAKGARKVEEATPKTAPWVTMPIVQKAIHVSRLEQELMARFRKLENMMSTSHVLTEVRSEGSEQRFYGGFVTQ